VSFFLKTLQRKGPLSLKEFMELVLYHPQHGYYQTKEPIGARGDFITAPEISQLFGEMIGLFIASYFIEPSFFRGKTLVELGPGKGTLLKDALRVLNLIKDPHSLNLHLVETSKKLKDTQSRVLRGLNVQWHTRFKEVPLAQSIIIANEFFDALPIDQYECQKGHWYKRCVAVREAELEWVLQEASSEEIEVFLPVSPPQTGEILEVSSTALTVLKELADFILKSSSLLLVIDYGYSRLSYGDTLQALYHHTFVPPFSHVGKADLTSHVNFAALKNVAETLGCKVYGPITQGTFLKNIGIEARAQRLKEKSAFSQRREVEEAMQRLIHPQAMGELFKVMVIAPLDLKTPFGF